MKLNKFFIINSIGVMGHPFAQYIDENLGYFDGKKIKNAVIGGKDDNHNWFKYPIA